MGRRDRKLFRHGVSSLKNDPRSQSSLSVTFKPRGWLYITLTRVSLMGGEGTEALKNHIYGFGFYNFRFLCPCKFPRQN